MKPMIIRQLAALISVALLMSACAVGNQYDYRAGSAKVPDTGDLRIAVAVTDLRSYVLSGEKSPNFVGLQRGGFGNPFDVTTSSGAPMAVDFAELIRSSFAANDTAVDVIPLNPGADVEAALAAYRNSEADRLLLLEIHEWKTDVYAQVTVHWNLTAKIFDRSGRLLAEESVRGTGGTGTIGGLSDEAKGQVAATEASRLLGELLNRPAIKDALG